MDELDRRRAHHYRVDIPEPILHWQDAAATHSFRTRAKHLVQTHHLRLCKTGRMSESAFELMGGREAVITLAEVFYDTMERDEPALTAVHHTDEDGRVSRNSRDRFGLFLVGWLGGPQDYIERHGHPRLRMRHREVPIDIAMRDAWMRCMTTAMDERGIEGPVRVFLDQRFTQVADFLRNRNE